jgi:hypothetical protein
MSGMRVLVAAALVAGCVINTRPHLPNEDGDAAVMAPNRNSDGTDFVSGDAAARGDAPGADVLTVGDASVPANCPGDPGCAAPPDAGASFADASGGGFDTGAATSDATTSDASGSLDGGLEVDASPDVDGSSDGGPDAARDAARDATTDATTDLPDAGLFALDT